MSRLIPALVISLALAGCASVPEVSTLPDYVQEEARERDPRLQELYERYHPVPGPGLHVKTAIRKVTDQRTKEVGIEAWVYLSGAW